MAGHDTIVMGASAGGMGAITTILGDLPPDLPAAIFVVQHIPAAHPSLLAQIFSRAGALPAVQASNGALIKHGQVYVAPPDHHMLVRNRHVHVVQGPKENGFRPAIDATFRTAARTYGPRVVGVILSGMLDDGTAGLLAIHRRGGRAVVQDPAEADFPNMPESACRYVPVDAVLPVAGIAPLLVELAHELARMEGVIPMPEPMDLEAKISGMNADALQQANTLGTPVALSCPDCGGVLMEFYDGDLLRFRCQVGHAFSQESLFANQSGMLDHTLWSALSALDERMQLAQRLAEEARALQDWDREHRFRRLAHEVIAQKEDIRRMLVNRDLESGAAD